MSIDPVSRLEQAIDLAEMSHNVSLDGIRATIEMYVAEAVAREREECALIADEWATFEQRQFGKGGPAAAIRARAGKETT